MEINRKAIRGFLRKKEMIRKTIAISCGIIIFLLLSGMIFGIFARLGITPVGKYMTAVYKDRDLKQIPEFFATDEGLELMLESDNFMKFIILPIISVFTGFLCGWIAKTNGWLYATIAVGISSGFLAGSVSMRALFSVTFCIIIAGFCGYISSKFTKRRQVEYLGK